MTRPELDGAHATRFAELALDALHREYPNKIAHLLTSDDDVAPPRALTPLFFGCFDWHSAVHSHWCLVRLLRSGKLGALESAVEHALDRSFSPANVRGELAYLSVPGRKSFELPYGMAWLLLLATELAEWNDPRASRWHALLQPLEALASERLAAWFARLPLAVRTGEHTQSAFALGLALDCARLRGQDALHRSLGARALALHQADRDGPLHLEPSGFDFFSPCLAEADLMRRVLAGQEYARWLDQFLPALARGIALDPVACPDPSDARLAHLDGLNLSRAWMLEGIASALRPEDVRRRALLEAAANHARVGTTAVTGEHYEGSHWQGSFAVYLLTRRGLPADARR